jgi:lipopolysaccharide export system protein LptA
MNHLVHWLLVLIALSALPAAAEKADRNKPLNAEADALRYDDLRQSSVFTGNVVITKGSIVVRGARVEVSQTPDGYQRAVVTGEPGKLAYYRSKRDGVDESIEGEAELIEYDSRADTVQFTRQAVLRRYVGAAVADETTGGLIRYDNTRDVFTVDGSVQPNRNAGAAGGRVRAMLSPRAQPGTPSVPVAPGAPLAPLTPGAASTPQLRPTPSLGGNTR